MFLRALPLFLAALSCTACYPRLMPVGPVVAVEQDFLGAPAASGLEYSSRTALRTAPVLPFIPWGLDFAEEMLFEFAHHPDYGMVEFTRVRSFDGREAWFALVSERSGVQHVVR